MDYKKRSYCNHPLAGKQADEWTVSCQQLKAARERSESARSVLLALQLHFALNAN